VASFCPNNHRRPKLSFSAGGRATRLLAILASLAAGALGVYAAVYVAAPAAADTGDAYSSVVMADNPVDWWRLNETTGTYADGGSFNLPLTPSVSVTRGVTPCLFPLELNCAYTTHLATTNALASETTAGILSTNADYTIEFAIKVNAGAGTYRALFSDRDENTNAGVLLYLSDTNHLELRFNGNTPWSSAATLAVGTAYYVQLTLTQSGSGGINIAAYVNGTKDATTATNVTPFSATSGVHTFFIGARLDNAFGAQASIQDFAIYNTSLSVARLAAHYSAALNGGAGSGGGTTTVTTTVPSGTTTVVQTTPGTTVTNEVLVRGDLSADDQHRLDLAWWGVWALVGLGLVALIAPLWYRAWRHEGALGG
jgi:hypothetical protein